MPNYSYGNRGMAFESLIEYANKRYRIQEKAIIEKQHTLCKPIRDKTGRIVSAKYDEKATVDFMGRFGNIPIAFEAKECSGNRIELKRVQEHQCKFLRDWTRSKNAIGFIIIRFSDIPEVYIIPWAYWQGAKRARINKEGGCLLKDPLIGTIWKATGKASIRADELPKDWKVSIGDGYGLNYLKTVKKLWRL